MKLGVEIRERVTGRRSWRHLAASLAGSYAARSQDLILGETLTLQAGRGRRSRRSRLPKAEASSCSCFTECSLLVASPSFLGEATLSSFFLLDIRFLVAGPAFRRCGSRPSI